MKVSQGHHEGRLKVIVKVGQGHHKGKSRSS